MKNPGNSTNELADRTPGIDTTTSSAAGLNRQHTWQRGATRACAILPELEERLRGEGDVA